MASPAPRNLSVGDIFLHAGTQVRGTIDQEIVEDYAERRQAGVDSARALTAPRAPLISIKSSAATVLGAMPAPDPAEMLQFFRVIDEQADRMRGLIADLLDQGRIETGTLSVSLEAAEVAGLVDQARSTFLTRGGGTP